MLVIPEDFSRRLRDGEIADVQVILNGDNANTATTVLGYTNAVLLEASASLGRRPTAVPIVGVAPRVWYNPELRSTLFLVPGLIAYISMITAVVSTALSIVREKENGHDGAGADGADLDAGVRHRQDAAVPGALADRRRCS